jgi:DNA-binding response OmpR family regulator
MTMSATKTILLVDDDNDLREALAEQFDLHDGFEVLQAPGANAGIELALSERIDMILLDVDMPDMDGREACKMMRQKGVRAPIIMLTGQDGDADTILGLESGANDYVTKPFKFSVLLARVRAHLRSFEQSEDATFQVGPYDFRPSAKSLTTEDGRKVRLTEKETNILKYLYRAGGKPVARDELLSEVWGYNAAVTTHTLETHIYRLRQKIEPDPSNARLLLTDAGGYRLQP